MERMDRYEELPRAMRRYLEANGWHFNKALFEYATGRMIDRNGNRIQPKGKKEVEDQLRNAGVQLKHDTLYDAAYVFNMAVADYLGSSLPDMSSVAVFVRDYIDDIDGSDTRAMDEYMGRSIGKGEPIPWEDVA